MLAFLAAWALDERASDGEPLRNVELAGRAVGGLDAARLEREVATLAQVYAGGTVVVATSEGSLELAAQEVGLTVEQGPTTSSALNEGRDEGVLERPLAWARSLVSPREAEVIVSVDRRRVAAVLAERDPTGRVAPVEPAVRGTDVGVLEVVAGEDGSGIDPDALADAIVEAGEEAWDIEVQATAVTLEPRFDEADAERARAEVEGLTAAPLAVSAAGVAAEVAPETVRGWVSAALTEGGVDLVLDAQRTVDGLAAALGGAGVRPVDAGFRVEGQRVVVVPGQDGTGCCAPEAVPLVLEAVRAGTGTAPAPDLPLRVVEPGRTTDEAEGLGVTTAVGSFTTRHAAGESRVTNIHRIADLSRGVVIEPGGTFSVNDHVGRRTTANGFLEGGVIEDGVFQSSVGGGISQFATTLFNAAFFGGLDFEEYQSHSIYISRYPYGREATLSFPAPDLVLRNSTPHGVLLWPTYTGSTITVTLYSTPFATGEQTAQSSAPRGACTRVTTQRTRTYVDGRREVDEVYATYRPGEGVDC